MVTSQVNLTADQRLALQIIARSEKRSVDDLVQHAVAAYLKSRRDEKQKAFEDGFGAWGSGVSQAVDAYSADKQHSEKAIEDVAFGAWGPGEDGLAYQERLRREW